MITLLQQTLKKIKQYEKHFGSELNLGSCISQQRTLRKMFFKVR